MQSEQGGPGGLRGLRAAGLLDTQRGVAVKSIGVEVKPRQRNALSPTQVWSYRAGNEKKGSIAVELDLKNPGATPWTLAGAVMRGPHGEELTPLSLEEPPVPILPGLSGRVMVEFEATAKQAQGAYTLTLWDADGRSVILDNVTFP